MYRATRSHYKNQYVLQIISAIVYINNYFNNVLCCVGPTAAHFCTAIDNAPNSLCCTEFKTGLHPEATQFATLVALTAIPEKTPIVYVCMKNTICICLQDKKLHIRGKMCLKYVQSRVV